MAKILVVDDAALDRKIARLCIEELGQSVITAENGCQAIELVDDEQPDIILTDLQMPEMDGLELVQQIRCKNPQIPVVLMTAYGSEETAVAALRAGATSYVPKKNLRGDLGEALRVILATLEAASDVDRLPSFLDYTETRFVLGYEPVGPRVLINHLQSSLSELKFCDQVGLLQISTALTEALTNAIDHGNLELDSALRESPNVGAYRDLGYERSQREPYRDRRVYVTFRMTSAEANFVIRDEGTGFDPSLLPDPTDPENLLKPGGRGVTLIRTFMDEVSFNDRGNEITMIKRRPK